MSGSMDGRRVRRYMGRPDGIIFKRWFYWLHEDGSGVAFGFSDGEYLGWDMLFRIKESQLERFELPAR